MESEAKESPPTNWSPLDREERRVLGVLVEKAKTTPDAYPLSINALVTGCNQKSNRDPVLNLSDVDVEDALVRCQKKGLTIRVQTSGRVIRWRHNLYDAWEVEKVELAILAELLLRGPQTEGELRGRASRMEPLEDLDALREVLRPLVDRRLVVYLTAEERRGAILTHGFHDPAELAFLRKRAAGSLSSERPGPAGSPPSGSAPPVPATPDPAIPALRADLQEARQKIATLEQQVAALQARLEKLGEQFQQFQQELGG
jgi:uncharacterized protein YceH (UPF0502 family)